LRTFTSSGSFTVPNGATSFNVLVVGGGGAGGYSGTYLYYYKARMYNAALGRFMQTDPIGYKDDINLYTYVGNDPLGKTDPAGLLEIELGLNVELFIGGGIKLGGGVSFDTQTLEVGANGTFGIGGGVSAGVGVDVSVSESSTKPAQSETRHR
jgi:RHS repeat-associated protein